MSGVVLAVLVVLAACGGASGGPTRAGDNTTTGVPPGVSFDEGEAQPTVTNLPSGEPEPSPAPTEPADPLAVRPESVGSPLPEVPVLHVQTGDVVQLKNLLPASTPLLVWFWAPH